VADLAAGIGTAMGLPGHSVRGLRVIGQLIDDGPRYFGSSEG